MGLSAIAYSTLPRAVQAWAQELGWKPEDITSYHMQHRDPAIVTLFRGQEKRQAYLSSLPNGQWTEKVIEISENAHVGPPFYIESI